MRRTLRGLARPAAAALALLLGACAGPVPPDWQSNAKSALERAVAAYLAGDTRVATAELERARSEVARTGRVGLLARVELMHCAARVASLVFEPCAAFEKLRPDAAAPERAYADYLAGRLQSRDSALLPAPHRPVAAAASADAAQAALRRIDDPLSRLIAAGVLLQTGHASPEVMALAVDSASAQGWRRPLLAWLNVQLMQADKAGDTAAAERLRRRIAVVLQADSAPR